MNINLMICVRAFVSLLALPLFAASAQAHEAILFLTAQADGTVLVETAFSDGSSTEGMPIRVTNRASGEVLSEHELPQGGMIKLPIPPVPYRVTFDGGPGHKVTKMGPASMESTAPASTSSARVENGAAVIAPARDAGKSAAGAETPPPSPAPVSEPSASPVPQSSKPTPTLIDSGQHTQLPIYFDTAVILLLAVVSFGLGFSAAKRSSA